MAKFFLKVKAELSNVTELGPIDNASSPFEYTFKIECTKCREVHPKPVLINRFEQHDVAGSKGEASFVFRCKACKTEHLAQITRTKELLTEENNGKWVRLLEIDARGMDFLLFVPEGRFACRGLQLSTLFDSVDLEDAEWYDYDEAKGLEVSVIDVEWDIARQ